jgi:hypothetical protein
MEITVQPLTKAEENCAAIGGLVKRLQYDFLELGGLLLENRDKAHWRAAGAESFKDFIQDLGISYDWSTRLIGLAEVVAQQLLTTEDLVSIGVAKACLLLPHAKNGTLTEDQKLLAQNCTWNDLRKELGHNLTEKEIEEYVVCSHCGFEMRLYPGMINRR